MCSISFQSLLRTSIGVSSKYFSDLQKDYLLLGCFMWYDAGFELLLAYKITLFYSNKQFFAFFFRNHLKSQGDFVVCFASVAHLNE